MAFEKNDQSENRSPHRHRSAWGHIIRGLWRTPLGIMSVVLTTISATLMVLGIIADLLGLFRNPYVGVWIYMIFPICMVAGLLLIPITAYLRRRQWHKSGVEKKPLKLNLSNPKHRWFLVGFIVLTVVNVAIFGFVGYEGYHFTDSPYFCGMVCHQVMAPEYTAYQRSPHSRVSCVECHIGPGAEWFVKAKISGLRQVYAVVTNSYARPIPTPVEALRPARDTCETCHWPEKFYGKKVKKFYTTEGNETEPQQTEISLHIGGRNPVTKQFEGIHWHVSKDVQVEYLAVDEKRTKIAKVRIKMADGTSDEFIKSDMEPENGYKPKWRVMDCIDCHNRPTHIYSMPEEVINFGLLSKDIDPAIPGIRQDSLAVLTKMYDSRKQARERMIADLMALQKQRNIQAASAHKPGIERAGQYLLKAYLENVWPANKVFWGTYKSHLGHQWSDQGFGCWRCHDEEHINSRGEAISQDCSLCHDEPE